MTGDYTAVPLRRDDLLPADEQRTTFPRYRWTGARMQQGRVLLDHEWNLNVDAAARATKDAMRDVVGPAGVQEDSDAFLVSVLTPPLDLVLQPGRMWVDGWEVVAPTSFRYSAQDQIDALPSGHVLAYLDVFQEHVQPAERPDELIDPALVPVESSARTRIRYRVRVAPTNATSCDAAFEGLNTVGESTGRLTIDRATPTATSDPCDPPGDPLGLLPEGLFRVEVLDGGTNASTRFAWSVENGAAAVAATFSAEQVTLAPSTSVKFANGDLVEMSWLARRADRKPHGPLYKVTNVSASAAGDVLTLDRPVAAPVGACGIVARRWDGEVVGAAAAVTALVHGIDMGLRFTAGAGSYLAGDWWGARLRSGSTAGVERRLSAPPDGVRHAFAPLALLDLVAPSVLSDCRLKFPSLVGLDRGSATCTVTVFPGDDIQAAVDALPATGGEVCIAAGEYVVRTPIRVTDRKRVVITGVGPATVLRSTDSEIVVFFERSEDIEIRHLRVVSGAGTPLEGGGLNGAVTFDQCSGVTVTECELACPDATVRDQACVTVRGDDKAGVDRVAITANRLEVGTWQTGVLVTNSAGSYIARNDVRHVSTRRPKDLVPGRLDVVVRDLSRAILASLGSQRPQPVAPLTAEYRAYEESLPSQPRSRLDEIRKFLRTTFRPGNFTRMSSTTRSAVLAFLASLAAAGQGIVVAGTTVGTVRVHDNVVDGAIQGIHVGASHAHQPGREQAREVVVSRNVVHARVPAAYTRERHAVFVGNARSVHVTDTVATLARPGVSFGPTTNVDGICVHGVLGAFLLVRQTSLHGFLTGVRVRSVAPEPAAGRRMWLVAETMAAGATLGVDAPVAAQENNFF